MPNIQDVAKKAGVSVATVSRVLNQSSAVIPKTKEQVMQAVEELGYKPLRIQKPKSGTLNILVLVPDVTNNYYANVVKGISDCCDLKGKNMILCNTDYDSHKEKSFLNMMDKELAEGAILLGPQIDGCDLHKISEKYPVVQCCEYIEDVQVSHVSIDNGVAAREAMRHLVRMGHRRIALILCNNNFISTKQREEVYYSILKEEGIPIKKEYIVRVPTYDFKNGIRAMMKLLQLQEIPTAVFALSDFLAIGAVSVAISSGYSVPDDIAIVGFDDLEFASMYTPSITTIAQPRYDIGYCAADLLLKKIVSKNTLVREIFLEHELKIRASTVKT